MKQNVTNKFTCKKYDYPRIRLHIRDLDEVICRWIKPGYSTAHVGLR